MITPTQEYRRIGHRRPEKLFTGLDAGVHALSGYYHRRGGVLDTLRRDADAVEAQAADWKNLTDHDLRQKLHEYRDAFRRGERRCPDLVIPALAAIRETAERQIGLRPFPVQIMGALALHRGYLAEMATGEGKTLTAGLAAVLAGWTRRPCHIITVNDYLVQRDPDWLKQLYQFCGVRVGTVTAAMNPLERQQGYAADVTYATSKEILADFLRDRLRLGGVDHPTRRLIRQLLHSRQPNREGLVMRGLHTAIVDEADSVLIDEAVTPLIISSPSKNPILQDVVKHASEVVAPLESGTDYTVSLRYREVELTDAGREKVEAECASLPGLWHSDERRTELIKQALQAREFYRLGKQYIISEGKIVIVDEFTGRPMPQRSWRQGMHQAIEAKEGLEITDPSETIARLSFQRFFRYYHQMSGMTGTAHEAATEFWQIYRLPVVTIPTNKPCIRQHGEDRIFLAEDEKWRAIVEEIERVHGTGRPVLVGTRSVAASDKLALLLTERKLEFKLLNAVRLREEALIIAEAGQPGRITIATNMAGRGTDIKLGQGVAERGGLHVIATERHESGRVDRQLFGRAARQGDPGSAQAFVSADDELVRRYLSRPMQRLLENILRGKIPGQHRLAASIFKLAQNNSQNLAFKQRKSVLRMDTWLEESLSFTGSTGT
ncbi:MAG: preprotein translocase subunit SecA [Verrucomicrobiota bacterium]